MVRLHHASFTLTEAFYSDAHYTSFTLTETFYSDAHYALFRSTLIEALYSDAHHASFTLTEHEKPFCYDVYHAYFTLTETSLHQKLIIVLPCMAHILLLTQEYSQTLKVFYLTLWLICLLYILQWNH